MLRALCKDDNLLPEQLTTRTLRLGFAYFIILYALDVPRIVIEVWRLPVPYFGGSPPYLIAFALISGAGLIFFSKKSFRFSFFCIADIYFLSIIFIFLALEAMTEIPDTRLIAQIIFFYTGYILSRAYRNAFGDLTDLATGAVLVSSFIASFHLLLLIAAHLGWFTLGAPASEILQKNSISFLLLFACFVTWFKRDLVLIAIPRLDMFLLGLAFTHCWLNNSRSALIALAFLAAGKFFLGADHRPKSSRILLAISLIVLLIAAAGEPLLHYGISLIGEDDDAVSVFSRFGSNSILLERIMVNLIFGLGFGEVDSVRVFGYPSHTLPLIIFASTGLLGSACLVVLVWVMLAGERAEVSPVLATVSFLLLVGAFVNDAWIWKGLLIGFVGLQPFSKLKSAP